nr:thermonuclease family protein [Rhizobium sp. AQ_MP]
MFRIYCAAVTIFLSAVSAVAGSRLIDGPVAAELIKIIDGDTVLVEAMPWPDHKVSTYVRLRGIDAPELRSKCPAFRKAAQEAKSELASLMDGERMVQLTDISGDKYFGRVVADLTLPDGTRPADRLLEAGLAERYAGKQKIRRTCPGRL